MGQLLRATLVATLATAAGAVPTALASTLELVDQDGMKAAVYTAAPGEKNDLWLGTWNNYLTFSDSIGPPEISITTSAPCAHGFEGIPEFPSQAYCPDTDIAGTQVSLGDEDDTGEADHSSFPVSIDGGAGLDVVGGSTFGDYLAGGDGDDVIYGFGGADLIDGGPGADVLWGFAVGIRDNWPDDSVDDTVTYEDRAEPVTVTMDGVADDGEAGEGDNVEPTIENVVGGSGSDTLSGNAAPNWLDGEAGDDVIYARGGGVDVLDCGEGDDAVVVDYADEVGSDCEAIDRSKPPAPPKPPPPPWTETETPTTTQTTQVAAAAPVVLAPVAPGPVAAARDSSPPAFILTFARPRLRALLDRGLSIAIVASEPSTLIAQLRRGAKLIGVARGKVEDRRGLVIRINRTGRKLLAHTKSAQLRLTVKLEDAAGNVKTVRRTIRLGR